VNTIEVAGFEVTRITSFLIRRMGFVRRRTARSLEVAEIGVETRYRRPRRS
jgi:hypothetical protein